MVHDSPSPGSGTPIPEPGGSFFPFPTSHRIMDPHDDLVELLIDGARYGDVEDVEVALVRHGVAVDSKDEAGRTGELLLEYW